MRESTEKEIACLLSLSKYFSDYQAYFVSKIIYQRNSKTCSVLLKVVEKTRSTTSLTAAEGSVTTVSATFATFATTATTSAAASATFATSGRATILLSDSARLEDTSSVSESDDLASDTGNCDGSIIDGNLRFDAARSLFALHWGFNSQIGDLEGRGAWIGGVGD